MVGKFLRLRLRICICTVCAKKPDHFCKCVTPVYADVGRRPICQNVHFLKWSGFLAHTVHMYNRVIFN